ncbi:MAG: insulinase family protein [Myxococcales bacterium]|nr:insulinase family protein [Myxococcales bacterium]MDH5307303.1 insulinase family protein [Myxococcales bacterium]MDH5566240.1 insulinase family protein [Myxococcales bacterium]
MKFAGYEFRRRLLGNGLHGVAVRDEGEDVSVFLVVAAGKRQETAKTTGLAHLTEHAMYTGTATTGAGDHDRSIVEMGGRSNAFTREDYTLFYDHKIPADRLGEVLAMEADRLRNLSFDPSAIYEERGRLRDEEAKTWQPSQQLTERVEAMVYRVHPYGAGIIDEDGHTFGSLLGIWDLRDFYDQNYQPDRVTVVVAGAVEPERALDEITDAFADLPAGPPVHEPPREPAIDEPRSLSLPSTLPRDRVEWVYLVPAMGHADRPALHVLARLLSRRTTASGAPLFVSMGDRVDQEMFRFAVVGPAAQDDLEGILEDLLDGGIDASELEEVKRLEIAARQELSLRARPYFSLAATFGVYEVLGHTDALVGYVSAVEDLTVREMLRVARAYFSREKRVELRFEGTGVEMAPLPDDPTELQRAADEATQAGDLDWAVAAYTKLLSLNPSKMTQVIALASRGEVWMQKRDYRAAIADFERALELVDYPDVRDLLEEARALEAGELRERTAERAN